MLFWPATWTLRAHSARTPRGTSKPCAGSEDRTVGSSAKTRRRGRRARWLHSSQTSMGGASWWFTTAPCTAPRAPSRCERHQPRQSTRHREQCQCTRRSPGWAWLFPRRGSWCRSQACFRAEPGVESLRETQGRRALCNGIRAPGPGRAQAAMGDGGRGAEKEDTVHASRGVLFFDTRGRDESTAWMQKFHEKFTHQLSAIMGRTSHCTRHAAHPLAPWPPFPSDTCFHTNPLSFPGP